MSNLESLENNAVLPGEVSAIENSLQVIENEEELLNNIDQVQLVSDLQENIQEQEEVIKSGEEISTDEVIQEEIKLESFINRKGLSRQIVSKSVGIESFGKSSNLERYKSNLEIKKKLLLAHSEDIKNSKASILAQIRDSFTKASDEFTRYMNESRRLLSTMKQTENNVDIKSGIEISPLTASMFSTPMIDIVMNNYTNMLDGDMSKCKSLKDIGLNCSKYYYFDVANALAPKASVSNPNFIPLAVGEKATRVPNKLLGFIKTWFHEGDDTFLIMCFEPGDKTQEHPMYVYPDFDIAQFTPAALKLKTNLDVVKAAEKIVLNIEEAHRTISKVIKNTGYMRKEQDRVGHGVNQDLLIGPMIRNSLALNNVRLARAGYHAIKELNNLIS